MNQIFSLFVKNSIGGNIPCLKKRNQNKLQRLYLEGQNRLEKECDIVKIIHGIRNLKIIAKNTIMDEVSKIKVQNDGDNIIVLDGESDSCRTDTNN